MIPNRKSYVDLLKISPYEFSWYNFYLQKSKIIPIVQSEPHFKTIHTNYQFVLYKLMGIKEEDWARSYIGIIVNSNFTHQMEVKEYNQMFPEKYSILRDLGQVQIAGKILFHSMYRIIIRDIKCTLLKIFKRK